MLPSQAAGLPPFSRLNRCKSDLVTVSAVAHTIAQLGDLT